MQRLIAIGGVLAVLALVAGCGSKKSSSTSAGAVSAADCSGAKLATKTKGQLTVATDKPAYPPYFENNDPTNGKGFESAVAYAIAGRLGISKSNVNWVTEP